jgi:hypothetical protein
MRKITTNKKNLSALVLSAAMLVAVLGCGLIFSSCGDLETDENVYTITFTAVYSVKKTITEGKIAIEYEKDALGEYVLDEYGNKVPVQDEDGFFVPVLDENGNPVYEKDANGKEKVYVNEIDVYYDAFLKDENGNNKEVKVDVRSQGISRRTDGVGRLANFPSNPTRPDDYIFDGWWTTGGTRVTEQTIFTTNTRVLARWKAGASIKTKEGPVSLKFKEIADALTKGLPLSEGTPNDVIVEITENESLKPLTLEIVGARKVNITLKGNPVIDPDSLESLPYITISESGSLFTVGNNVTLTLIHARMEGNDRNTRSLLTVNKGGKLIIGDENNKDAQGKNLDKTYIFLNGSEDERSGGAITVNTGGELIMNGGDIYQCSVNARPYDDPDSWPGGGGVLVRGGTFTMNGGNIERCYGRFNGGAVLVDLAGRFTMTGGQLYDNTAPYGGGAATYRGGLFELKGGTIKENLALEGSGVFIDAGAEHRLPYDPRKPTNYDGMPWIPGQGGYDSSKPVNDSRLMEGFYMTGGTIQNNHAVADGGGIYNYKGGIVFMTGGTISGNIADDFGGGVQNAGLFIMLGGDIQSNRARYGAGVMAAVNMFVMEGGNIKGNRATAAGGGVFTLEGSFFMMGGTLGGSALYTSGGDGNYADGFGGGVAVYPEGNFAMGGGVLSFNTCGSGYGPTDGMISFFDSTDPKLLGFAWYGKRPAGANAVPGDPILDPYCRTDFKNEYGVPEVLILSYLMPYSRNPTTGLVTALATVGFATNTSFTGLSAGYCATPRIEVRDGKLYYGPAPGAQPPFAAEWE